MNHIFKVVFSQVLGRHVVVSELASSIQRGACKAVVATGLAMMTGGAWAVDNQITNSGVINGGTISVSNEDSYGDFAGGLVRDSGTISVQQGADGATARGRADSGSILSVEAESDGSTAKGVAWGNSSILTGRASYGVTVSGYAYSSSHILIGDYSRGSIISGFALNGGSMTMGRRLNDYQNDYYSDVEVGTNGAVIMGAALTSGSFTIGDKLSGSMIMGLGQSYGTMSIGDITDGAVVRGQALNSGAMSIGEEADGSVVAGIADAGVIQVQDNSFGSVAIGASYGKVVGSKIQVGKGSKGSVAIGYADGGNIEAGEGSSGAVAIGYADEKGGVTASGKGSVAIGYDVSATADYSTALGSGSKAAGTNSLAALGGTASGEGSVAIGLNTSANSSTAIAIGHSSTASGPGSVAMGYNASVTGTNAIALGNGSEVVGTHSLAALGGTTSGTGSFAVGSNASATGNYSTALGSGSKAAGSNSAAIGVGAKAEKDNTFAIGSGATVSGSDSLAIGNSSTVSGNNSIAIGTGHTVSGSNSGAFGDPTYIAADNAYAIGNSNTITNSGSAGFILGNSNTVSGEGGIVVGSSSQANNANALVLGNSAQASVAGGVALGYQSVASTRASSGGYNVATGATNYVDSANQNAWKSTAAAVSVGDGTSITRQITSVAAGTSDTDAVNVAQLKMAAVALSSATAASRSEVVQGANTSVTSSVGGNSQTVYTVNAYNSTLGSSDPNVTLTSTTEADGYTTAYNIAVKDMHVAVSGSSASYSTTDNTGSATLVHGDGTLSTITGLKDTYVTSGTVSGNTLKLTRNDGGDITVDGIAMTGDTKTYTGDSGTFSQTLREAVTVKGGYDSSTTSLTEGNIGVEANSGTLSVKLAKDVNLGDMGTVTVGNSSQYTVLDKNGLNITSTAGGSGTTVRLTNDGSGNLGVGGAKITNVAAGENGSDAVNVSQLSSTAAASRSEVTVEGGREPGTSETYSDNRNLRIRQSTGNNGQNIYDVKLGDIVTLGSSEANGSLTVQTSDTTVDSANVAIVPGKVTVIGSNGEFTAIDGSKMAMGLKDSSSVISTGQNAYGSAVSGYATNGGALSTGQNAFGSVASGYANGGAISTGKDAVGSSASGYASGTGSEISTSATGSTALGYASSGGSISTGKNAYGAVAMGYADGNGNVTASGKGAVAMGYAVSAIGDYATALGNGSSAVGTNSLAALGGIASGTGSVAIGEGAFAQKGYSYAIGQNASATVAGSVALGSNSVASTSSSVLGYDPGTGSATTNTSSSVWTSTAGAVSVGDADHDVTRQITGVAAGTELTDAVNVAQLQRASTASKTEVTVEGWTSAPDSAGDYTSTGNLLVAKKTGDDGHNTYDIKLNKDIDLGESGTFTIGGTNITNEQITVNNGTTITRDTITTNNLVLNSSSVNIAEGALNVNGQTVHRIKYTDPDGDEHRVATLDDGTKYRGDNTEVIATRKLNEALDIKGGAKAENLTAYNIGVNYDTDSGAMKIQLSKDLTNITSISAGSSVKFGGTAKEDGTVEDPLTVGYQSGGGANTNPGNYVTGLSNTTWVTGEIASGRAATEDQLQQAVEGLAKGEAGKGGFGLRAGDGERIIQDLGTTVRVYGDADPYAVNADGKTGNITTTVVTAGDGHQAIQVNLNTKLKVDTITAGSDSTDGKPGVTLNGTDGAIGMTGTDGTSVALSTSEGVKSLNSRANDLADGDKMSRLTYQSQDENGNTYNHTVATMDDGLQFTGDDGKTATRVLGSELKLHGGAEGNLSDNNIGVNYNATDKQIEIKLAKDLKDLNSAEFSDESGNQTRIEGAGVTVTTADGQTTKVDGTGITITPSDGSGNAVSLTGAGLDNGGNKITNVAAGIDAKDAVNVGQLQQAVEGLAKGEAGKGGFGLRAGDGERIIQDLGTTVRVYGDADQYAVNADGKAGNITTTVVTAGDGHQAIQVNLNSDLKVDTITAGSDGTDGKPGVTLNGTDGSIGMTGTDGTSVALSTSEGVKSLNNSANDLADGDKMSRLTYQSQDENGNTYNHTVATMDDGLQFTGDDGKTATRVLGSELKIHGGAEGNLSDNNIGVNYNTTDKQIEIKLAKDLKDLNSAEFSDSEGNKTTINASGITTSKITVGDTVISDGSVETGTVTATTVKTGDTEITTNGLTIEGGPSVTKSGIDAANNKVANVADGEVSATSKDAINGSQLYSVANAAKTEVKAGDNVKVDKSTDTDGDGHTIYTVSAEKAVVETSSEDSVAKVTSRTEGLTTTYDISVADMHVKEGTATYEDNGTGKIVLTHKDDTTTEITGLKDTYIKEGKFEDHKITLTHNDSTSTPITLNNVASTLDTKTYNGDSGSSISQTLGEAISVKGGADTGSLTGEGNIGVVAKDGTLSIQLAKDIKNVDTVQVNNSVTVGSGGSKTTITNNSVETKTVNATDVKATTVTTGDTTINNEGVTVKNAGPSGDSIVLTKNNVSMGGNRITNVAPGVADTDAVNVSQMNQMKSDFGRDLNT